MARKRMESDVWFSHRFVEPGRAHFGMPPGSFFVSLSSICGLRGFVRARGRDAKKALNPYVFFTFLMRRGRGPVRFWVQGASLGVFLWGPFLGKDFGPTRVLKRLPGGGFEGAGTGPRDFRKRARIRTRSRNENGSKMDRILHRFWHRLGSILVSFWGPFLRGPPGPA